MSEKQLDFLHVFDQPREPEKKEDEDVVDEEGDRQSVRKIEINQEQERRDQERRERMIALLQSVDPKPEDFEEFKPLIEEYSQRLEEIRREYQEAAEQPERLRLYYILVRPDLNDAEEYQGRARLYLKYKEAENQVSGRQRAEAYAEMFRRRHPHKKAEKKIKPRSIDLEHGKNAAARLAD
ncbi:MAG: hypothetical protein ACM3PZ_03940 [Bacillota bacterium]